MARKATGKKCRQCSINPCAELWLICAICSAKNAEYAKKIDRDRLASPARWGDEKLYDWPPLKRDRKTKEKKK